MLAALVLGLIRLKAERLADFVKAAGQPVRHRLDHCVHPPLDGNVDAPHVPQDRAVEHGVVRDDGDAGVVEQSEQPRPNDLPAGASVAGQVLHRRLAIIDRPLGHGDLGAGVLGVAVRAVLLQVALAIGL